MDDCVHDWIFGELNKAIAVDLYWYAFDCVSENIDEKDWDIFGCVKYNCLNQYAIRLAHVRFKQ